MANDNVSAVLALKGGSAPVTPASIVTATGQMSDAQKASTRNNIGATTNAECESYLTNNGIGDLVPKPGVHDEGKVLMADDEGLAYWSGISPDFLVSGATPSVAAEAGKTYVCAAALTSLTVTTSATSGIFEIVFKSGSTAAEVTLPQNVLLPDGFDFEADTYYDLSVRMCTVGGDSVGLAAVGAWPVPAGS